MEVDEGMVRLNFNWTITEGSIVLNKGTGIVEAALDHMLYEIGLDSYGDNFFDSYLMNWVNPKVQMFNLISTSPKLPFNDQAYLMAIINTQIPNIRDKIQKHINIHYRPYMADAAKSPNPFSK